MTLQNIHKQDLRRGSDVPIISKVGISSAQEWQTFVHTLTMLLRPDFSEALHMDSEFRPLAWLTLPFTASFIPGINRLLQARPWDLSNSLSVRLFGIVYAVTAATD